MMNRYPLWKNILLGMILLLGLIYAAPNLFGEDPAVQISPKSGQTLGPDIDTQLASILEEAELEYKSITAEKEGVLVRFLDDNVQIKANELIRAKFDDKATVALNLAPVTPKWLDMLGAEPMKLGLDLRGGVHFLLDVDIESAFERRMQSYESDIKSEFRQNKLRWNGFKRSEEELSFEIKFAGKENADEAYQILRRNFQRGGQGLDISRNDSGGAYYVIAKISPTLLQEMRNYTVEQTMTTLRNRVNELGVAEAVVQRQGLRHIVVELPGIQDTARAKDILGKTATLQFMMEDTDHDIRQALAGKVPPGSKIYYDRQDRPHLLKKRVLLTGDSITGAYVGTDSQGLPAVSIRVGGGGLALFKKATRENIGKPMATLYIETKVTNELVDGEVVKVTRTEEKVINVATIRSALGRDFQITGVGLNQAQDLSLLLRSGALPATISIVEERTVGPSLGQENIRMGIISVQVGLALVLVSMLAYYSVFGLIANVALLINIVLLVAVLSLVGATLTLPGIAGIVLTVGMAVDANVLIFERIREEMRNGMSPQASIHSGFERALSTIIDANITTLIVALILFSIGTGPVKGFAVTLSLGILTSMLTAITGTRAIVNFVYGGRSVRKLRIGI